MTDLWLLWTAGPQKVVENIPDYPGFERDVFQVVCDYFSELNEPVITYELYPILLRAVRKLKINW